MADTTVYPGAVDPDLRALVPVGTLPESFKNFEQLIASAVRAVEVELGIEPSGGSATLTARLALLDALVATLATGGFGAREFIAGKHYLPWCSGTQGDGTDPDGKDSLVFLPFPVGKQTSFDRIGTYIATGQADTNVRVGLYDTVNGVPTNLLAESGSLDSTVGTTLALGTIAVDLNPGLYWLACVWQGAGATMPSITRLAPLDSRALVGVSAGNIAGAGTLERYYYRNAVPGALPNPSGGVSVGNSSPIRAGWMRAA